MKHALDPKGFIRNRFEQLKQLRDAPHAVAGGVAIGMFWGFTPLTGLKTLLSIFLAWILRCSKLSAAIAVSFHDILIPVWPLVLRWEYQIGFWMLANPHRLPPKLTMAGLRPEELLRWKSLELLWPTFLGSLLFGLPVALISYWVVERSLEHYEHTHHRHLTPPA